MSKHLAQNKLQDDPIVMYLIVRQSLSMGVGKTAAQCCHATQMLMNTYSDLSFKEVIGSASSFTIKARQIFTDWFNTGFRKVVLRADEKEWAKLKLELNEYDVIVIDSGLTEIAPNSETVIGLFPIMKSNRSKLVSRLQAL